MPTDPNIDKLPCGRALPKTFSYSRLSVSDDCRWDGHRGRTPSRKEKTMRKGFRRMLVAASTATAVTLTVASAVVAHAAASGCQVTYKISSQWSGGFGADVTVT